MPSLNHQYPEKTDNVVKRYKRTSVCAISGIRLNPFNAAQRLPFILEGSFNRFDVETNTLAFDYSSDVIELYSEDESRVFERLNPYLFQHGLLAPYYEQAPELDTVNVVDDETIAQIADSKTLASFKKQLAPITSKTVLERIKRAVVEKDKPHSYIVAIEAML